MHDSPPDDPANAELRIEQSLALAYVPREARPGAAALWQLDARMRRIFASGREPAVTQIKLAWWEERLGGLRHAPVPAEPLLQGLASHPTMNPADLAGIAEGWRELCDASPPSCGALERYARKRGRSLVRLWAGLRGSEASEAFMLCAEGYTLVDLARLGIEPDARTRALAAARERFRVAGDLTWPRALRPLGMIVELARGDAAAGQPGREGSPARVARMAWHALSGR